MTLLRRIAGVVFLVLGCGLLALLLWDLAAPATGDAALGLREGLPLAGLGLLWLAVGLWLLRRKRRGERSA
jgi:hypothetical protein